MRSILAALCAALALASSAAAGSVSKDGADRFGEAIVGEAIVEGEAVFGEAGAVLRAHANGTKKFDFVAEKAAALKGLNKTAGVKKYMILDELEAIITAGKKPSPCEIKNATLAKLAKFGKGSRRSLSQTSGEAIIQCGL
jgi:hypothetical protein